MAAWWTDEGADLYLDWAEDVNAEHSACTTTAGAAYTAMTTAIATANNTHAADTPEGDPAGGDDQTPPTVVDPEAVEHSLDDLAAAESTWQKALSAAALQLALATEAAGQDAQALAAAQAACNASLAAADLAYQQSAADAQGDAAIANAQATDDYVDSVYGQAGDYETWQDALDSAENTYDLARTAAEETRDKNIAALDAALEAALADTYADALEQLALDHPSPWSTRAAADARAESNKTSSEQTARTTFDNTVFTATADFQDAVAAADLLKSDTQTSALGTYQQAQSQAALTKVTAQAADNTTAAAAGVGTQHKPDEKEIPDAPEDLVTESLGEGESGGLGTMPLLDPAESAALIDGQNGFCTTLDLGICFAAGTPVLLADGTTRPIEQIQPGDQVLSAPEDDAEVTPTAKTVERVFHNPPSELIRLTIAGQEIRCTPPHLFYVKEKGWTAAQDLQVGDQLRTPDARWVAISAKEDQPQPEPVFNLRVADYHTYFVGNPSDGDAVLVHNEYEGRRSDVHIEGNIIFYDGTLGRPKWEDIMHLVIFRTSAGPRGYTEDILDSFIFWPLSSEHRGPSLENILKDIARNEFAHSSGYPYYRAFKLDQFEQKVLSVSGIHYSPFVPSNNAAAMYHPWVETVFFDPDNTDGHFAVHELIHACSVSNYLTGEVPV